jgi:uncharacterized membrane protein
MERRDPLFVPSVIAYGALMFAWSALRHAHYGSHAYDLGAYHQVFVNLAYHARLWSPVEQMHQWSAHLELGLLPLAIPYRVVASPLWLLALQSVLCAATALPLERLGRHAGLGARLAALCAWCTLITPQLLFAEIYDFHSITLCAYPMALVALGIELDRAALLIAGAAFALSFREQMGLAVAAAGVAWVVRHGLRRVRAAIVAAAAGLAVFVVEVAWLIPSFDGGGTFRYLTRYDRLGGSLGGAVRFAARHPLSFLALPFEGRRRLIYPFVVASGATAPLTALAATLQGSALNRVLAPLLVASPLLAVQLYASSIPAFSVEYQYGAPLVPLVGAAAILAVAEIRRSAPKLATYAAAVWIAVTFAHAAAAVGPLAIEAGGPLDFAFARSARASALSAAVARVPFGASVSAADPITPHLEGDVRIWPANEDGARFVLLDVAGTGDRTSAEIASAEARLRADSRYRVLVDDAGVLLVERAE